MLAHAYACRWVRLRLPLAAGDDLVGPDRRWVERHLARCEECRGRLESLRAALGALQTAAAEPPVAESPAAPIWPELQRQIRESRRPAPTRWAGLALPIAAALAVTAGVAWSARLDRRLHRGATARLAAPAPAAAPARPPATRGISPRHREAPGGDEPRPIALDTPTKRRRGASSSPADRRVVPPAIH